MRKIKILVNLIKESLMAQIITGVVAVTLIGGGTFGALHLINSNQAPINKFEEYAKENDEIVDKTVQGLIDTEKSKGNEITKEEAKTIVDKKLEEENKKVDEEKKKNDPALVVDANKPSTEAVIEVANEIQDKKYKEEKDKADAEFKAKQDEIRKQEERERAEEQAKAQAEAKAKAEAEAKAKAQAEEAARIAEEEKRKAEEAAKLQAQSGWRDDIAYAVYGDYSYNSDWTGTGSEAIVVNAFNTLVNGGSINPSAVNKEIYDTIQEPIAISISAHGVLSVKGLDSSAILRTIRETSGYVNIRNYMLVKVYYDGATDTSTVYYIGCNTQTTQYGMNQ